MRLVAPTRSTKRCSDIQRRRFTALVMEHGDVRGRTAEGDEAQLQKESGHLAERAARVRRAAGAAIRLRLLWGGNWSDARAA